MTPNERVATKRGGPIMIVVMIAAFMQVISMMFLRAKQPIPLVNTREDETVKIAPRIKMSTETVRKLEPLFPTISCHDFLKERPVLDPNRDTIYVKRTMLDKPFYVSLHNKDFDFTRWVIFEKGHYYERQLERIWQDVLKDSPEGSRVLDVGGNIGFYSLVSASMGNFVVDSFEPNPVNIIRFCESLALNGWSEVHENSPNVHIHPVGVSDQSGELQFFMPNNNPGEGQLAPTAPIGAKYTQTVPVVTLDHFAKDLGWFESKPNIAILKIDVEKLESEVLLGGQDLLQSGLVQNIFMEVTVNDKNAEERSRKALKVIVGAGYRLEGQGTWQGPGDAVKWAQDDALFDSILNAAKAEPLHQINLWWKLPGRIALAAM